MSSSPCRTYAGSASASASSRPRPAAAPDDQPADAADEEREADHARLAQELERQVVRLERLVQARRAVAQVREAEGAGARPRERIGLPAAPRLRPPRPAMVRAGVGEASGRVRHLRRRSAREPVPPGAGVERRDDDHTGGDQHGEREQRPAVAKLELRRLEAGEGVGDRPVQQQHGAEEEAVVHAGRVRLAVARHPRQGDGHDQRPGRGNARREQRCERFHPGVRERHPERNDDHGDDDPAARVREPDRDDPAVDEQRAGGPHPGGEAQTEREGDVAEERQAVPVADGPAQPGDAAVVVVEPRQHLAEQRPGAHGAEEGAEAVEELPRTPGDEGADERERRVDERTVGVVPAAVGLDRPGDRDGAPDGEQRERDEHDEPLRGALRREQDQDGQEGGGAEPGEARGAGPAAEEEGCAGESERGNEG